MIAASVADLDGFGFFISDEMYWRFHHVMGHSLMFGVFVAIVLAIFSTKHRVKGFALYLALFHLHLVMDYFGSGPGWVIPYVWPFSSQWTWKNPHPWAPSSWQNYLAAAALLGWTLWIAARRGRTPIELLAPRLDQRFVSRWRRMLGTRGIPAEEPVRDS